MMLQGALPTSAQFHDPAWSWVVCHSGSWIYRDNQYAWVAGHRHHRPCVQWVKYGHTVAFVPIHPHDVKNHLPVNRSAPVFAVNSRDGNSLRRVAFNNVHAIEVMKAPPKEFRTSVPMPLPRAADPRMEGHQLHETVVARSSGSRSAGIPITFDHHSQSFMMPNHAMEGARPSTGFMPITNRGGDLQSHSGTFSGGSYHSASGGGGFHGGGGSSGGASSAHTGGGSFSAPSGSSSGASGASSSSSGGSHK